MIFRPATPGFLVTLAATVLLLVVTFSIPYFKTVFFLKATIDLNNQHGVITFGVLGYCLNVGGNVNCTSPRLGYEFDPNALLGNTTPIQIPQVVVKWITYTFVLHIIALCLAAVSAGFGLLAHIREFSMVCCSTCISGFSASIALLAFILDTAFFFLFKARINKIPGGSAQTGNAIWLTLVAALLLFFAGCFYGFGRCCIGNRPRGPREKPNPFTPGGAEVGNSEALRLDAVKAEADRKARQQRGEVGLPAFQEYVPIRPLEYEDEPYMHHQARQASGYSNMQPVGGVHVPNTGYAPAAAGTSAMEAYYHAPEPPPQVPPPNNGYAPAAAGISNMDAYYHASAPQVPPNNGYVPVVSGTSTMDAYYNAPQNDRYASVAQGTSTPDPYHKTSTLQVPPAVDGYPPQPPTYDQYPSTQYNPYDAANAQPTHGQYASNEAAHGHSTRDVSYYTTASQYQPLLQSDTAWPKEKAS